MPRKPLKPGQKRIVVTLDNRYGNPLLARFINKIDFRGKKSTIEKLVYKALDIIKEKTKEDPLKVFVTAIENVRPMLEVKPRRVGGATYQVPAEVPRIRGEALAMRWILEYAHGRKGMEMAKKLGEELVLAYKKEGSAYKKREDTHKMAEANKAFAHYRW
ncbi:MAG: 30S ribosomal protein S7 [Elusimicrobia bacterium]|nr:30S ribosomal protein S7 [Elusimicrobiota bacterium]